MSQLVATKTVCTCRCGCHGPGPEPGVCGVTIPPGAQDCANHCRNDSGPGRCDGIAPQSSTQTREASELGLAPGEWPDALEFEGRTYRQRRADRRPDGEVAGTWYSHLGFAYELWLLVVND